MVLPVPHPRFVRVGLSSFLMRTRRRYALGKWRCAAIAAIHSARFSVKPATKSPPAHILDNDSPAPNMDIVKNTSIKRGADGSRRKGRAVRDGAAPLPYADLRPPMIFLIGTLAIRIASNPLKMQAEDFSNRYTVGAFASAWNRRILKNGDSPHIECAKMAGSTKGETALV